MTADCISDCSYRLLAATIAMCAVSCGLALGLGDFGPGGAGGAGGASGGAGGVAGHGGAAGGAQPGGGGAGGGGGGEPDTPAADWSHCFEAVYTFDLAYDLGHNSGSLGSTADMTAASGSLAAQTGTPPQGTSYLELSGYKPGMATGTAANVPLQAQGGAIAYGCWLAIEGDPDLDPLPELILGKSSIGAGYVLEWADHEEGSKKCVGIAATTAIVASSAMAASNWRHFVCRYHGDVPQPAMTMAVDGTSNPPIQKAAAMHDSPAPLTIGTNDFEGRLDECFVRIGSLSDDEVKRIWACGIDGQHCDCDGDEPHRFVDCGRQQGCGDEDCCEQLGSCSKSGPDDCAAN